MEIRAMMLSNGELGVTELTNTLEELQKIVGGYIEIPMISNAFSNNGIDVVINDEGKFIEGLKPEIAIVGKGTNAILDVVYGNCVFVSHDNEGNTVGLDDQQIEVVTKELGTSAMLNDKGKDFLVKVLFV